MYYPTYIPEEYVIVDVVEFDTRYQIVYQKENQFFTLSFDRENNTQIFDAVVSTRDDQTIVIWQGDGFSYTIAGNLEKEECLRILESVRLGD